MIRIDLDGGTVTVVDKDGERHHPLASQEAFAVISDAWLRCGWDTKYVYGFTWFGRPIIQLPEDIIRLQELVYSVKPDVIVETGVAHGGGQVFFASLCKAMGKGRVIGVDIEIRPHNRTALAAHELFTLITLIEGSSIDPSVVAKVKAQVVPGESALVLLDANHTKNHVLKELEAYGPLVGIGSYIVAADGIMENVVGAPRTRPEWAWDNPRRAVAEFLVRHPEFELATPPQRFNEGMINQPVTYWPGGYLRRVR
jgi:cephalosporin hydroxylase